MWASLSLRASADSHSAAHTAGGRCCCNVQTLCKNSLHLCIVSIPQAVGVVATDLEPLTVWEVAERVSIPQAVGVVATF